jgi:magnesium chelatase subunit D
MGRRRARRAAAPDRVGIHVGLAGLPHAALSGPAPIPEDIIAARERLAYVTATDEMPEALAETAEALGIASLRPPLQALRAACAAAALAGRLTPAPTDMEIAARLVLAPRATRMPAPPEEEAADEPAPPEPEEAEGEEEAPADPGDQGDQGDQGEETPEIDPADLPPPPRTARSGGPGARA